MPLAPVPVRVVRLVKTRTATAGYTTAEADLAGSPFTARVYRAPSATVNRDEAAPATATVDGLRRLSVLDPACPIRIGDVAYLPLPDGTAERAKVLLVRRYADRLQCDLETGAEGDVAPGVGGATSSLPPSASAQAQIDALTAQLGQVSSELGDLTVAFHLAKTGQYTPATTITASTTLTKPTGNTTYPIDTTSGAVVITLYASTGDGTDLEFVRVAGTNPVTFVLNAADTCPLPLVNTILANIGETQSFREVPNHVMEAH